MPYTARERFWLGCLALLGLAGLNGVFVWALAALERFALPAVLLWSERRQAFSA